MPYGSLSKAYRTEIALGHLHANLVSLFKIRQRRLQKTKSMSGNINNRGKYKKKTNIQKQKTKQGCYKWNANEADLPIEAPLFLYLQRKKPSITELLYQRKRVSPGERQMHVYDSQNSEMLKPLSFTRTICRRGGGLFNTLSSTYIPNRKKKA